MVSVASLIVHCVAVRARDDPCRPGHARTDRSLHRRSTDARMHEPSGETIAGDDSETHHGDEDVLQLGGGDWRAGERSERSGGGPAARTAFPESIDQRPRRATAECRTVGAGSRGSIFAVGFRAETIGARGVGCARYRYRAWSRARATWQGRQRALVRLWCTDADRARSVDARARAHEWAFAAAVCGQARIADRDGLLQVDQARGETRGTLRGRGAAQIAAHIRDDVSRRGWLAFRSEGTAGAHGHSDDDGVCERGARAGA